MQLRGIEFTCLVSTRQLTVTLQSCMRSKSQPDSKLCPVMESWATYTHALLTTSRHAS